MTNKKLEKDILKLEAHILDCDEMEEMWKNESKNYQNQLAKLKKKLEVKVYRPNYIYGLKKDSTKIEHEIIDSDYNAMEEYKYKLSQLNDGWFPDWNDSTQKKGFLYFSVCNSRINCDWAITIREHSDYEYFNPEIADQVLRELGNLWKRGKGIE